MSDEKYVGAIAAAKNAALTKAALDKKLDKTGGTVTGSLTVIGAGLSVEASANGSGNLSVDGPLVARGGFFVLNGEEYASLVCTGENAAKIVGTDSNYARVAVGAPSGDDDAATKAYVDAKVDATVYVDFWGTGQSEVYSKDLKAYTIALSSNKTYDAIFDLISSGANVIARLYKDSTKAELVAKSIETNLSGDKTLGNINFLFVHAATDVFLGFPTIADAIWVTKTSNGTAAYALYKWCALPVPVGDSADNGKVPTVNGTKWELKEPSSGDFMVNGTLHGEGSAVLDKTYSQIRDAITAGKNVLMQIADPLGTPTVRASLVTIAPAYLVFSSVDRRAQHLALSVVTVTSEDRCIMARWDAPVLDSSYAFPQVTMSAAPDADMEIATKKYVDDHAATDAVLYTAQTLTFEQKQRARNNIEALPVVGAATGGTVSMCPDFHIVDSDAAVHVSPTKTRDDDYTLTLDCGPENWPVRVAGIRTPTDAQKDYAANVAYVKAKIAEVAASGGVDVDNALSATSTNPVQNKVVTAALTGKAGTAVATESANGLMSKADKTKLDGIASGATKITIDSTMSGSSNNPIANRVIKQYVDDKVAAAGGNITVDATLSTTSTNPVQNRAVKAAIDAKADKTALDAKADKTALAAKMDKSGGTFTGNVYGKYFCGTWLQSTAASDLGRTPGKIAVLDDSGWVYYRTPAELFGDLGIANAIKSYVDTAIVAAINSAY